MRTRGKNKTIQIYVVDEVALNLCEASFLRNMAKFCVENRMSGSYGAEKLNKLLESMGVPEYNQNGVYGLFEDESVPF